MRQNSEPGEAAAGPALIAAAVRRRLCFVAGPLQSARPVLAPPWELLG